MWEWVTFSQDGWRDAQKGVLGGVGLCQRSVLNLRLDGEVLRGDGYRTGVKGPIAISSPGKTHSSGLETGGTVLHGYCRSRRISNCTVKVSAHCVPGTMARAAQEPEHREGQLQVSSSRP